MSIRRTESLLESSNDVLSKDPGFLASCRELLRQRESLSGTELAPAQEEPDEATRKREKLTSVSMELGVYLHYVLALSEFFGQEDLDQDLLEDVENSGWLDKLVRARHLIAVSPTMAESEIAAFRDANTRDHAQDTGIPQS